MEILQRRCVVVHVVGVTTTSTPTFSPTHPQRKNVTLHVSFRPVQCLCQCATANQVNPRVFGWAGTLRHEEQPAENTAKHTEGTNAWWLPGRPPYGKVLRRPNSSGRSVGLVVVIVSTILRKASVWRYCFI